VNGTFIAKTITNLQGSYILKFSGKSLNYSVTASYPGHVPSTKNVVVTQKNQTQNFYGFANFRLGPMPSLTITAPSTQLLNQTFNFNLNFNNTGNMTGFGPVVQLILPSQIQLKSATFLGAPVTVSSPLIFPVSGVLTDPLTGLTVTGTPGYSFYTLIYPLGSFTMGQPTAVINVNALLLGNSTLGVPLNITGYPVFRFGANATGTIPLRGTKVTTTVTPTVIVIAKTSNAHEQETATGRNYPVTYTLSVDVAAGRTVNNVVVSDVIPNNLQFIGVTNYDGGTPVTLPSTTTPGGILSISFGNVTGILGDVKTITYQVFAPLLNSSSQSVINPVTGLPVNATNVANVTGTYNGTNVSSSANYTLYLKSLAVQKNVVDITTPSAPRPTDILNYTVNFQVSDYFSMNDLVINDTLGDGQTFLTDLTHNPTLSLNLPNIGLVNLKFNLSDPSEFQMFYNSTSGITYLTFNVSQLLINNNITGTLTGGNYTGGNYSATQGNINFWSQININYENPDKPIVSSDTVNNAVIGNSKLVNSNNPVSDGSSTSVLIVAPAAEKQIYDVQRNGVDIGPTNQIRPGDIVTFLLQVSVPTTNLGEFYLTDYLPIPLFQADEFTTGQAPLSQGNTSPPAGQWQLTSNDTLSNLSGVIPSLVVDDSQNTLEFFYGNIYNSTQPTSLVNILFSVTATGDPMSNGLYLTNWMNVNYNNTVMQMFTNNQIVSLVTNEPQLTITKTASPNTGRQAGNNVTYTITIKNTGNAPAYNVNITDNLLSSLGIYINGTPTVTASYQGGPSINLTGLGDLFGTGLNFGTLYPIFASNETNNTIILTYNAILSSDVYPLQVMNNTAQITNFTSLPPADSTNFVTDPTLYQANATVTMLGPQFQKIFVGSQDGPSTGSNLTIGEIGRFNLDVTLPAGQINDLVITDTIPAGLVFEDYNISNNPNIVLPTVNFTQVGNLLTFLFPGTTNTTNGSNTFSISLDFLVANNNSTNPPHTTPVKNNAASMDWSNIGNSPINSNANVTIIEPNLQVTKTITPNVGAGGQKVTVTLQIKNIGNSTAYNVLITDPLSTAGNIFDLTSVQSTNQNGFIYSYPSNTITFTGGNITPNQTLTFTFNATVLTNVTLGSTFNNTAYTNYYSLLNGTNPDPNARNYTSSGWATFRAGDPTISKAVIGSTIHGTTGNLAIGENVTYRITVTLPEGQADNLIVTDSLPSGFAYVTSDLNSSTWDGTLGSLTTTTIGQNVNFLFNGASISLMDNNTFYIDLEALVMNVTGNVVGNTKTNNVNLTWDENSHGPFTASVNTTLVGPNLTIAKTVTPNPVDGSDLMNISLLVTNTGNSPAYEISLTDLLNSILFDPTTFVYTPVTGYNIYINGSTVYIIGNLGTFLNNTSGNNTQYFNFTVNATNNVPSNSTFTNQANGIYYSMPTVFNQTRVSSVSSNVVNIKTVAPSIAKVVNSTSEPDSTGNNVMIGEVVVYRLTLTIPDGSTNNVTLSDILPSNLVYNSGTAMIMRSSSDITASGFVFTAPVGQYEDYTGITNTTFNLGNILFNGSNGLHNGTISIIFNATVLNINANQNGTQIPNNVTFNFTNATGANQTLTGIGPTLNVIVPHLSITKTANPTTVEGGQTVTFNVQVLNNNNTNGAPAYNLQVLDPLVGYNSLSNIVITPSDGTIIYSNNSTSNLLDININQLNQTQYLNITYQAKVNTNVTYGQQVNNTAQVTGTSLPGDQGTNNATSGSPGSSNGKRTGDPTQPAGAVNNLIATSTATVTVRNPTISKNVNGQKTVNRTIDDTATENLIITLPIGTTNDLSVIDVAPSGLRLSGFNYNASTGISVTQFNVTSIGNNYTFDFGNTTASQDGNISISYTVQVLDIAGNINGQNLTNNATLFYQNITGQSVNAGSDTANIKVVEPNLLITKTASTNNLVIGEQFTYTLFIKHSNSSTSDANNIVVIDNLPVGLSYVPDSVVLPPTWALSVVGSTLTFSSPLLTLSDNNVTILFNCTVNNNTIFAGQNLTNTANMNYTSLANGGRDYGPVSSSSQVHIFGADLSVIKTGTSNVDAGQGVSYTVIVTNLGPDTADNVTFTDTFIASWFNQLINPQYSLNGGTFTSITVNPWTLSLGNILSGNNDTIQINAIVSPSAQAGILNNTANATSDTTDPNPNNNNDTKLTNVDTLANLTITKTAAATVTAGNSLVYTVVVSNNGPSDAQNVIVNDIVSVLSNVTWTLNGVAEGNWTGSTSLGVMTPGEVDTLLFNGTVPSSTVNGTVLNNTANVTSPTDPNVTNASAVTNVNTLTNLTITKTAAATVTAGNSLVYTVVVSNNGPSDAQNVIVNDIVPVLTGVTWTLNGTPMGGWTGSTSLGVMTPGEVDTLLFNGTVPSSTVNGTVLNNTANVTSPTDPNVTNASAVTNVNTLANLTITKTAAATVTAGNSLVYTVVVSNNGPSNAQNVIVNDIIPVLTGVTWTLNGTPMGGWTGSTSLGVMTPGEVDTLLFDGTVPSSTPNGTVLNNTANVTSPTDPNVTNASAITNVNTLANLTITKTAVATVTAGNSLVYTVVVTNNGPSNAQNVIVNDIIPVLSGVTWTLNGTPMGGWTGSTNLGVLTPGEVDTLLFTGTVPSSTVNVTVLNNTANVTSPTDPNVTNASAVTNVNTLANLTITKTAAATVTAGNSLVYTVVVTNNGPSDAQDVVVDDIVPVLSGVTWTLNGVAEGLWTGSTILGVLTPGEVDTLLFTGTVPSSTVNGTVLNNTANVTSPTDPNVTNASAVTNVNTLANLIITKTAAATVTAGNSLVYTVVVTNDGPSNAQNVIVNDIIPVLTGVTWTLNGTPMGGWTGSYNLDVMAPNDIKTLVFSGIVPSNTPNGTVLNNTANVTSPTDPNVTNASALTNVNALANLTIIKTGNASVLPGGIINYKIFIKNNGPSDALDVHLFDDINPLVTGAQYSLSGNTSTWSPWPPASGYLDLDTLIANQNETIFIMGTVLQSANQDIINTATVTSLNSQDMNSTVVTHLKTADIGIMKYASTTTPNYLDNVTFTIKAHNYGPDQATGVQVTDLLPTGLKYILSTVTQGTYNSTSGVWIIGNINNGTTMLLTILAQIEKTGNITNTANKTGENEYDPNPNNNQDSKTLNVPEAADLSITKTVKPTNPSLHETIIYTIIVHNHGPDTALNVYVIDKLPKGLTYISSSTNYGSYNPKTGIWTIGTVLRNTNAILNIKSGVETVGIIQNNAKVYSSTYDPTLNDRAASATVNVKKAKHHGKHEKCHGLYGNSQGKTIPMQHTGTPITALILAILMIVSGLVISVGRNRTKIG
jgi:uncharacterized repeat protein (TIGR01451 family)/fimbrial isopeptide formation D2 family protein